MGLFSCYSFWQKKTSQVYNGKIKPDDCIQLRSNAYGFKAQIMWLTQEWGSTNSNPKGRAPRHLPSGCNKAVKMSPCQADRIASIVKLNPWKRKWHISATLLFPWPRSWNWILIHIWWGSSHQFLLGGEKVGRCALENATRFVRLVRMSTNVLKAQKFNWRKLTKHEMLTLKNDNCSCFFCHVQ